MPHRTIIKPFILGLLAATSSQGQPTYTGLVGVQSTYTDGRNTLQEYVDVARQEGLDFLVFAEEWSKMDEESFDRFREECAALSTDDFLAVPGLTFRGTKDDEDVTGIAINPNRFPEGDLSAWDLFMRLRLFGFGNPGLVVVHPNQNDPGPYRMRFWTALATHTYEGETLLDDALSLYGDMMKDGYYAHPMAVHWIQDVDELKAVSRNKTIFRPAYRGNHLGNWSWAMPRNITVAQVEAPQIRTFEITPLKEGRTRKDQGELASMKIVVEADTDIEEITVYRGNVPWRRFYPGKTMVDIEFLFPHEQSTIYWLEARDADDRSVFSRGRWTYNRTFINAMCNDNQNNMVSFRTYGEDDTVRSVLVGAWHVGGGGGRLGFIRPSRELRPLGEEAGVNHAIYYLGNLPELRQKGAEGRNRSPELGRMLSSNDVTVFQYKTHSQLSSAETVFTLFRPNMEGWNMVFVESTLEVKTTVEWPARDGPHIKYGEALGDPKLRNWPQFSFVDADGVLIDGEIPAEGMAQDWTQLNTSGWSGLWPHRHGAFAFLHEGMDGVMTNIDNAFGSQRINMGLRLENSVLVPGEPVHFRYAFILGNGFVGDNEDLVQAFELYGYGGLPAYQVTMRHGEIEGDTGYLQFEAEAYSIAASVTQTDLPNPLGFTLDGLNPNWSVGLYDFNQHTVRLLAVDALEVPGRAYGTLDLTQSERNIAVGNILVCDQPELRIEWMGQGAEGKHYVQLHNPLPHPISYRLGPSPYFDRVYPALGSGTLKAGETVVLRTVDERWVDVPSDFRLSENFIQLSD